MGKKKLVSAVLCLILAVSVCGTSARAVTPGEEIERGGAYLVRSGRWNLCAGFTAAQTGVTITVTAYDTNTLDYNVRLCEGEFGKGTPIESRSNVPIGTAAVFEGLVRGEEYYFEVSSDTVVGSGIGAVYALYGFDTPWVEPDPPVRVQNPFSDVAESDVWFDAVLHVYERGIMVGTSSTAFSPNAPVTRAAVWTVLARMNGMDTTGGSTWYEKAREWAVSTGISDGSNPERIVSRQEIITMLYRQAGSPPIKDPGNHATAFGDMETIADWAYEAVIWAVQNDMLHIYYSNGILCPGQGAPRWELAHLLTKYDGLAI